MEIIGATQLKKGMIIKYEGKLYRVIEVMHHTQGRQAGYILTKLKNIEDNSQKEVKFRSADRIEKPFVEKVDMEYIYDEGDFAVFMHTETYEQYHLSKESLGDNIYYLVPNTVFSVLMVNNSPVGVEPPRQVVLRVVETEPYLKGATAQTSNKPAVLETGLKISVPFFIEEGDLIKIDPYENKYLERVK